MKIYRNRIVAFGEPVAVGNRVAEEWNDRWFDRDNGKILIAGECSEALDDRLQIARGAQLMADYLLGQFPQIPEEAILLGRAWTSVRGSFLSNQKRYEGFFEAAADEDRRISLVACRRQLGRIASIGTEALEWVKDEDELEEGLGQDRFKKLAVREPVEERAVIIPFRRPLIEIGFSDLQSQTGDA